jgi:hypothetical protein
MRKLLYTTTFCVAMSLTTTAYAVIIDFNELVGTNTRQIPAPYDKDGFRLFAASVNGRPGFTAIFQGDARYAGTPSLAPSSSTIPITLTRIDGGAFSLNSISFDSWEFVANTPPSGNPFQIEALGANNVTRSFTVALDNRLGNYQTFTRSNFSDIFDNVVRITFNQSNPTGLSFDDIDVQPVNTLLVSEPASLGVLGAGLMGLGLVLHKRSRQRSQAAIL